MRPTFFAIIFCQTLVNLGSAQTTELPNFLNSHDVFFIYGSSNNVVTQAEPVNIPGAEFPGIMFLQRNLTNISIAHQIAPFEFTLDTLLDVPALDYHLFRSMKQSDESLDWYFISRNPNQLTLKPNLFGSESTTTYPLIGIDGEIIDFEVTDINGNGMPEIVAFGSGESAPVIVWSLTSDGFTVSDTIGYASYGTSIRTQDLNYDRTPDFIVSGSPLRSFMSTSDSTWIQAASMPGRSRPEFVDLDGDMDIDFVAGDYYGLNWSVAENLLEGEFDVQATIPDFASGQLYAKSIKALDANQDGKMDILMSTAVSDSLYLWLNGSENYSSFVPIYGADYPGGNPASLADFDLDGDLDWLAVGPYQRVSVLENIQIQRGCTYPEATNYTPSANVDDASCIFPVPPCVLCPYDGTGDGEVTVEDLLGMLSAFGSPCGE